MRLLFKPLAGVITLTLLVGKPWGSINLRLIALCFCLMLSGCDEDGNSILTGDAFEYKNDTPWCSNPETLQTQTSWGECSDGWRFGSYNDCTNITTEMLEVKLMEAPELCPEGFTGGAIHDRCAVSALEKLSGYDGLEQGYPDCL